MAKWNAYSDDESGRSSAGNRLEADFAWKAVYDVERGERQVSCRTDRCLIGDNGVMKSSVGRFASISLNEIDRADPGFHDGLGKVGHLGAGLKLMRMGVIALAYRRR